MMVAGCSDSNRVDDPPQDSSEQYILYPIGKVVKANDRTQIVLDQKFQPGLLGLEKFKHLTIVYWFDRNDNPVKRSILRVHPRGNRKNPLTGVFACRSPVRPNLIALSLCKVLGVRDGVVSVDKIDAFDGTPILDIKPYCPGIDRPAKPITVPAWLKPK